MAKIDWFFVVKQSLQHDCKHILRLLRLHQDPIWTGRGGGGGGGEGGQPFPVRVFAEYLTNDSTDFHQTYVSLFRQLSRVSFEIRSLQTGHFLLLW